jgi:predicted RNase H-like HicB family nuclease
VDGKFCFPPEEGSDGGLGWLVALGDTPKEVLDRIKELADLLPDGLSADVEALAGVIQEIDKAKEEDIHFTDEPVPEPATVLEN